VSPPLVVVPGRSPIVLVAPHGGRRDALRRPWGSAPLKMNDLHTASLTRELAARVDASALVNESGDRNDVDLNRISATHDAAPEFLAALASLVEDALTRHARVCLVTVHGWNVAQPAVDVGIGVAPARTPSLPAGAAVSEAFATRVLPRLALALDARGIAATPGLRYPARARENLLQLFTGRHEGDPRPLVRRLAALAPRVDAVQLELALPLRLPGPWRDAFADAFTAALVAEARDGPVVWPPWTGAAAGDRVAFEFVAPGMCGLAAIDERGGRLLLFLDDGRLVTFTGERVGAHDADRVAGLRLAAGPDGRVVLAYDGPMLAFPDTRPFVDLEDGLSRAAVARATVALELVPSHRDGDGPCPAGAVAGHARLDGVAHDVRGHGVRTSRAVDLAAGARASLRLADGTVVVARGDDGFVCRGGRHTDLRRFAIVDYGTAARLHVEVGDGALAATADVVHRLPVVPGVPGAPRVSFAACRHDGALAGWIQLRSG
jgi:hypothetical protein